MYKGIIFNLGGSLYVNGRTGGGHRIASELRSHGWDIEVVDFFFYWSAEELQEFCRSRIDQDLKFIGFGALFAERNASLESFCSWLKINYPNIVLIYGSQSYVNIPDAIDYYITGFGEIAIIKLLEYLFSNAPRPIITPVDDNKVIFGIKYYLAAPWKNPIIIYEDRDFIEPYEWLSVEFSRGCKFKCDFCNFPLLGVKGDFTRDADNFDLQLRDTYDRFGTTSYIVTDETFNDRVEKITKFADVVEQLNFTPFFTGFIRADLLVSRAHEKEELLRMNFLAHFYGVETFNHSAGKTVGKGMHPDKLKQGLIDVKNYFQSHGRRLYRGTISLIAGLPYESENDIEDTSNWLREYWAGQHYFYFPLEIYDKGVNTDSQFTLDFEKYGYRKMGEESIIRKSEEIKSTRSTSLREGAIIWENDFTNYFRVSDLCAKIQSSANNTDVRLSNFSLAADFTGDPVEKTLLKLQEQFDAEVGLIPHVKKYISKKLNWTSK